MEAQSIYPAFLGERSFMRIPGRENPELKIRKVGTRSRERVDARRNPALFATILPKLNPWGSIFFLVYQRKARHTSRKLRSASTCHFRFSRTKNLNLLRPSACPCL